MNVDKIQFGLDTFGDLPRDANGNILSEAEALRQVVREAELADQLGIDVFAVGEHHREEYAISAPEVVLAGIATRTENIKLSSAVTVLSSDDPVRVFQRFSTVDALSNGRAQVIIGRGSFTESFPLFGYDLTDYDELFEEKAAMFSEIIKEQPLNWQGKHTQTINNLQIYPRTESGHLDTWEGIGGSPESIIRAARYGFKVMIAIIGGNPERFKPYMELYHRAAEKLNMPEYPIGIHSHGVIAEDDAKAFDIAWNNIKPSFDKIGEQRGWAPFSHERFAGEVQEGSMYVGSPETVARRIANTIIALGIERFDLVYGAGTQSAEERLQTIELYGKVVIPRVRELLKEAQNEH